MAVQYCNYDIKGTLAVTGVTTLSNQNYDSNLSGTIDAQYIINVSSSDYTKSGREISFISSSKVLELSPSHPLPSSGINSGSLAVTGSNLAFYDGHQWKKVTIGTF